MTADIPYIKSFKARPEVFISDVRLCKSELTQSITIESNDLSDHLVEIYPDMSLAKIFEWILFFDSKSINLNYESLAQAYGFFWNESTEKVFESFKTTPECFKKWADSKKAHANDLKSLTLISKLDAPSKKLIYDVMSLFKDLNPSLNDGKKIIELCIDNLASNSRAIEILLNEIKIKTLASDKIIKKLTKIRYPLSTNSDDKMKKFILKSNWPSAIKVKFQRQGDKAGFEVSTYVSTTEQAKHNISKMNESLESLSTYFKNKES